MAVLNDLIVQGSTSLVGDARGTKFIVNNGSASQFMKADGTLDSNAYITGISKSNVTNALGFTPISSVTTSSTNGSISVNGSDVTAYTHPTTAGNKHIPSGGSVGNILGWDSAGTAKWIANTDNNYYISGATTTTGASNFSVSLSGTNAAAKASFTIPSATTSAAGVMAAADKTALNNLNPLSGKVSTLTAITATSDSINSLTGAVGSMAFQNTSGYSSATQVNTALQGKVGTATTVSGSGALEGGGNLSSNKTITHKALAPSGASGKTSPNTAQTPTFGGTFNIPVVSYDKYGHITAVTTTTVTIPSSAASWNYNYYISGATTTTGASNFSVSLSGNNAVAKASFTIPAATTSAAGVMAAVDKTALNKLNPLSGKVSTLSAITATSAAINSLTGAVGSMAFQNTSSYSSATQVNTALSGKVDTSLYEDDLLTISSSLNDLNDRKLDVSAYTETIVTSTYSADTCTGVTVTSSEPFIYFLVTSSSNLNNQVCPAAITNGQQCDVIYRGATSADTYTVTVSTNYVSSTGDEELMFEVPAGGYVEINYVNIKGTIFVRGI